MNEYQNLTGIELQDSGDLVYFLLDLEVLFNINLSYEGIKSLLRQAFNISRSYVPYRTGTLRKSMTMEFIENNKVLVYFDPFKILGKKIGKKSIISTYYPKYLKDKPKTFNWLDIIFKSFIDSLTGSIRKLIEEEQARIEQEESAKFLYLLMAANLLDESINTIFNRRLINLLNKGELNEVYR